MKWFVLFLLIVATAGFGYLWLDRNYANDTQTLRAFLKDCAHHNLSDASTAIAPTAQLTVRDSVAHSLRSLKPYGVPVSHGIRVLERERTKDKTRSEMIVLERIESSRGTILTRSVRASLTLIDGAWKIEAIVFGAVAARDDFH